MSENNQKRDIFRISERIEGDKVIWIIVLTLIMFSILAISSSTPLLAIMNDSSRSAIINEQLFITVLGLGIILFFYTFIKKIGVLRFIAKTGFFLSFLMLAALAVKVKIPPLVRAIEVNHAVRALSIMGFQLHVFEFSKVLMVMYLAWAVQAVGENKLKLADRLGAMLEKRNIFILRKYWARLTMYIFLPMALVTILTLMGSVSSALFITLVMSVTVLVGGIKFRYLFAFAGCAVVALMLCVGLHYASGKKLFKRFDTALERISATSEDPEEKLRELKLAGNTTEFNEYLDKVLQPISAKVAVSEGGIFGKGPGGSTQRYIVPIMFEDYMFSFIVEEYGLIGALLVMILYGGLLARGTILVRNSSSKFTQTAIAGLVIMISGQALMHMFINADVGPLTGQTLPMISHGNSSFLAFSMAFGIILAVSRMVKKRMDEEVAQATPLLPANPSTGDHLKDTMDELDQLDSLQ